MPAFAASLALVTDLEANENKIYIVAKESKFLKDSESRTPQMYNCISVLSSTITRLEHK